MSLPYPGRGPYNAQMRKEFIIAALTGLVLCSVATRSLAESTGAARVDPTLLRALLKDLAKTPALQMANGRLEYSLNKESVQLGRGISGNVKIWLDQCQQTDGSWDFCRSHSVDEEHEGVHLSIRGNWNLKDFGLPALLAQTHNNYSLSIELEPEGSIKTIYVDGRLDYDSAIARRSGDLRSNTPEFQEITAGLDLILSQLADE